MKETRAFQKEISEAALKTKEKHFEGTLRITTLDPTLLQGHGYETEDSELEDLGAAFGNFSQGLATQGSEETLVRSIGILADNSIIHIMLVLRTCKIHEL